MKQRNTRICLSDVEFEVTKCALQFRRDYLRSKEELATTTERIECLLIEKQLLKKKFNEAKATLK